MDGRASRGPGRAVGDTRQSTMVDLGVGSGPHGFRRVLGPPVRGRRFGESQIFLLFFCYLGSCGKFSTPSNPASWRRAVTLPVLTSSRAGAGRRAPFSRISNLLAFFCYLRSCGQFSTHSNLTSWRMPFFDTPKVASSRRAIFSTPPKLTSWLASGRPGPGRPGPVGRLPGEPPWMHERRRCGRNWGTE